MDTAWAGSEVLADRAAQLDPDRLGEVVRVISVGRRVDVYGVAVSGLVAAETSQKPLRIRLALDHQNGSQLVMK
ncbi:hypothetical protein ABGB18_33020 [Nonomuraea sp. B12E4]|uniref:hypothetical protein n=1 Tax=Nonomuraea sp. B12E4 TaxID=3153564 RepID=UPI00325E0C67